MASPQLLNMPAPELMRELVDSNMLEYAQSMGVLPAGAMNGVSEDGRVGQAVEADGSAKGSEQLQSGAAPQPALVGVNLAADAAVEAAERALAQARGTVAVLAGFDHAASSRSTSYGAATGDEAAGGGGGGGGSGSIGIVRRAARRGGGGGNGGPALRGPDQMWGGGGGGGSGYGAHSVSYGYGGGGGGGGASGFGGYGQQPIGPLGFAPSERTGGKQGKGLRHFSMKVCEKVESKGTTTYNEVADELVAEMKDSQLEDGVVYDEKNIRRRVYDAINVLMALDVISKEKKAIMWRGFHASSAAMGGLAGATSGGGGGGTGGTGGGSSAGGAATASARAPVGMGAIARAQEARAAAAAAVDKKATFLAELLEQQRALKALMARNADAPPPPGAARLELPFILVQAKPDATVEVSISDDSAEVQFDFSNAPFQVHDDSFVVRMIAEENKRRASAGLAVAAAAVAAAEAAAAAAAAEAATAATGACTASQ